VAEATARDGFVKDVTVQVLAAPGIADDTLAKAIAIVARVYQAFGVRLQMSDSAAPPADGLTPWRRVVVKSSATKEFPSAFGSSHVMGISPRNGDAPGRIGYVFFDAVSQTAKRNDLPLYMLLGYAMAHELGHLLLPTDAHGKGGVMRANWDANDMRLMRLGRLGMEDREVVRLQHYLDSLNPSK